MPGASILDAIGNTPVVRLERCASGNGRWPCASRARRGSLPGSRRCERRRRTSAGREAGAGRSARDARRRHRIQVSERQPVRGRDHRL